MWRRSTKIELSRQTHESACGQRGISGWDGERERKSGGEKGGGGGVSQLLNRTKQTAGPQDERGIDRDRRPASSMLMPTATKQAFYWSPHTVGEVGGGVT